MGNEEKKETPKTEEKKPKAKPNRNLFIGIAIAIFVVILIIILIANATKNTNNTANLTDNSENSESNKPLILSTEDAFKQEVINMLNESKVYPGILKDNLSCNSICNNPGLLGFTGETSTCIIAQFATGYTDIVMGCDYIAPKGKMISVNCVCATLN